MADDAARRACIRTLITGIADGATVREMGTAPRTRTDTEITFTIVVAEDEYARAIERITRAISALPHTTVLGAPLSFWVEHDIYAGVHCSYNTTLFGNDNFQWSLHFHTAASFAMAKRASELYVMLRRALEAPRRNVGGRHCLMAQATKTLLECATRACSAVPVPQHVAHLDLRPASMASRIVQEVRETSM